MICSSAATPAASAAWALRTKPAACFLWPWSFTYSLSCRALSSVKPFGAAAAGWLAGQVTKGRGFGLVGNLIVGVIGAVVGGVLFNLIGLATNSLIRSLATAFVGAVLLLLIVRALKKP